MCNSAVIHPASLELLPSNVAGQPVEDMYDLRLLYKDSDDWQHLLGVHVPRSVLAYFKDGAVNGFALAALVPNSRAALAFNLQPRAVVMGVEFRDGSRIDCTPQLLKQEFWRLVLRGAALLATSALVAVAFDLAVAAAGAGLASHLLRTAASVPRRAAW